MPVYFIQAESGPVKIGHATDVQRRLSHLQSGSHEALTVIHQYEGGYGHELALHKRFTDLRIRGEWFRFHSDMLRSFDELGLTPLDPPLKLTPIRQRIIEAEEAMASAGCSINDFCAQIGVNRSTWTRWKAGRNSPRVEQWIEVDAAIRAL